MRLPRFLLDLLRGALIGTAEIIPGVSGGTIALIVGVYTGLITSAGHLVRGAVRVVIDGVRGRGLARARAQFAQVRWMLLLPIAIGMGAALVIGAAILGPVIEDYPTQTRAVFAGLIAASIAVPMGMVSHWRPRHVVLAVVAAVSAFALTSIPGSVDADPALPLVFVAAAVAVCALVLPGVSGSFLLLTMGMYAPTIAAVNDRDLVYLGTFAFGAIVGLGLFVTGLQWLLEHRRDATLAVMTGLMVGSLRALWPWQTEDGGVLAPQGDILAILGLFLLGVAIVVALLIIERRLQARQPHDLVEGPK
ncbi:DUF368 domain-containing protein [Microbacterium sediminicola]|uniref:DUF368 domain-containing protein n=1 Tax=Microbacterium sediminicola TaxID=415210 RepID=A0ABN2HQU7_9MICO